MNLKPRFNSGDILADRYRVVQLLSSGFIGEVYKVIDVSTECIYIVKVLWKDKADFFPEYIDHLRAIIKKLVRPISPHLLLPVHFGATEKYFFLVQEYVAAKTLDIVIRQEFPLHPSLALSITAQIAEALFSLHSHSVIHADIKPANILLSDSPDSLAGSSEPNVYLIDLGMAEPTESQDGTLIVGTYAYLPPEFRKQAVNRIKSGPSRIVMYGRVGTYIDIYALGVTCFEMLTGELNIASPLSRNRISSQLLEGNTVIRKISKTTQSDLAGLLFAMLTTDSSKTEYSAKSVYESSTALRQRISAELLTPELPLRIQINRPELSEPVSQNLAISQTLERLESIAESISAYTAAFISTDNRLESLPVSQADNEIISEMSMVFSNALARSKNSWRITAGMTVTSFLVIASMIVAAVTMTITTGNSAWTLMFGGASVALVLGTLIWRPFDRMFRATILSQQIEMIHLQTISAFRGTKDPERRIQLCREAITSLETLFSKHADAEYKSPESRKRRTK